MFLFSRFFRFDVYTYVGHRKKTASSSYCDSLIFAQKKSCTVAQNQAKIQPSIIDF